ncbi:ABC transporter ATP-binding protein [Corynebacterium heidelbergense]|uniref:ABC transporter ATP-binding protein n=1 Tax=Corynebacterium heidelbergense TaxID=2055947 RepID=A0A364VAI6_9CORY|nr:ABC transporter ATP-binding protein [Corynebacterium heidelbergense]RAV33637.1 ABC transporter ATP-binding protein [Corynebacterium heidelbergense]WCZ36840.1 putative ABC transporter ATP-binding protein YbhF [Corynebacterium heidelbergense]
MTPTETHTSSSPPAISLRDVHKTFPAKKGSGTGHVAAVDGISFDVRPGEVLAFLGPNGAGKSTTIDMICGFTSPTSGDITVLGQRPTQSMHSGRISVVQQSGGLLPDLTVVQTMRLAAAAQGLGASAIEEPMQRANVAELSRRKVSKCSGGEQQRVRFALALLPDPDLIILDEPTTGMDVTTRREFWEAISADAAAGRTIIFATHYLQEAETYAERVMIMARGHIVADGSMQQLQSIAGDRSVTISGLGPDEIQRACDGLRVHIDPAAEPATISVAPEDSDELARRLLHSPGAHDLHITGESLEDVFLQLTSGQEQ